MRSMVIAMAIAAVTSSSLAIGQQASTSAKHTIAQPVFVVKTVPLRHLSSQAAMKLLSPYSQTPGGGVYELSLGMRAVTIREVEKTFNEMMAVLAQYDRDPAMVTLSFQLIAAENGTTRDPAVAGLDSLLRGVLKFSGYRLLTASVANASEGGMATQTLSADGESLNLSVIISDLRMDGNLASIHLEVDLTRPSPVIVGKSVVSARVLSTGVTVPMGQTVVLGTSSTDGGQKALILTVKPQLTTPAKR